jgi:hypothetical protein
MNRPTGVMVIAILDFLGAAFAVLLGILAFVGMGLLGAILSHSSGRPIPAGVMAGVGVVLGIGFLIGAAISAGLGWGMWNLKEWARIVQMVFAGIGALFAALALLVALVHFRIFGFFFDALRLAINGLILWYLNQPHVVSAFRPPAAAAARTLQ